MACARVLITSLLAALLAVSCVVAVRPVHAELTESDFLAPDAAFKPEVVMTAPGTFEARFRIAPGYYLYRERMGVVIEPSRPRASPSLALNSTPSPAIAPSSGTLARSFAPSPLVAPALGNVPGSDAAPESATAPANSGTTTATPLGQVFAKGKIKHDPTFGKDMEVYYGAAVIAVTTPVAPAAPTSTSAPTSGASVPAATSSHPLTVLLSYQGCADAGLCYPPQQRRITVLPPDNGIYAAPLLTAGGDWTDAGRAWMAAATGGFGASLTRFFDAGDTDLAAALGGLGVVNTVLIFLVLGILLSLTPCVLPMVPILASLVVGDRRAAVSRWRGLGLAVAYVLGMSVVYTLLGVAAGLAGVGLAAWLQAPWMLIGFAVVLALFALASFGVFTLQVPAAMQARLSAGAARIPGGKFSGAALTGAVSALIVGPCVAAPLAGALLYISRTGDVWLGAVALFALAWGMGVPLLLVGAFSRAVLPRTGAWMQSVNQAFGVLLLATAWWMVLPVTAAPVQMIGWAFLLLVAAVLLHAFDAVPDAQPPARAGAPGGASARPLRIIGKAVGLLFALCAIVLVVGAASGGRDTLRPLDHLFAHAAAPRVADGSAPLANERGEAPSAAAGSFVAVRTIGELDAQLARAHRPVMLDFYADWCVSCKEMERFTFSDPAVAARLSRMLLLRADVTANSADDRALLKRYGLFGPPGTLLFDAQGRPAPGGRIVGFQSAERFGPRLDAALAAGSR